MSGELELARRQLLVGAGEGRADLVAAREGASLFDAQRWQRRVGGVRGNQHVERQHAVLRATLDDVACLDEERVAAAVVDAKLAGAGLMHDDAIGCDGLLQCHELGFLCRVFAVNQEDGEVAMRVGLGKDIVLRGNRLGTQFDGLIFGDWLLDTHFGLGEDFWKCDDLVVAANGDLLLARRPLGGQIGPGDNESDGCQEGSRDDGSNRETDRLRSHGFLSARKDVKLHPHRTRLATAKQTEFQLVQRA